VKVIEASFISFYGPYNGDKGIFREGVLLQLE